MLEETYNRQQTSFQEFYDIVKAKNSWAKSWTVNKGLTILLEIHRYDV